MDGMVVASCHLVPSPKQNVGCLCDLQCIRICVKGTELLQVGNKVTLKTKSRIWKTAPLPTVPVS